MFPIFLLIVTITQFYVSGCLFSKIACRKSFGTLVHWYTGTLDTVSIQEKGNKEKGTLEEDRVQPRDGHIS